MEQDLVSRENIAIDLLPVSGIRGKGVMALLKAPWVMLRCVTQAWSILRKHEISLVLGFGGFASGPGGLAAALSGRKLLIHEQNAVAGMTNKMLAKLADAVCEAFDGSFPPSSKVVMTGNPLRQSLLDTAGRTAERRAYRDKEAPINLLIIGGSRGAAVFNNELPALLASVAEKEKLIVMHQCGRGNAESVEQHYAKHEMSRVTVKEFIYDMDRAYQWADIVVCRAGALTVSEVAVMGLPAIFVPYPFAVDDHQTKNAQSLVKQGAAELVRQDELNTLVSVLNQWVANRELLHEMSQKSRQAAITDAKEKIVARCEQLLGTAA
jgi:UDP-N-acetylglucosamine--N-acetylmuramyl-(pentapeptide) pyrophosphoryl-undecaprenol N-acetylglucosamine transferase